MTRTIDISGIITTAETDHAYFQRWIETGVITPENRVTKAIAEAAEAGEGIVVRINSFGGDVLAGGQMCTAIQDFKGDKSIEIGAFAASMAANIVLQARCPVKCHENTIVLFHSARVVDAEGGPEALRDEARMLEQVNAPIKARLVALGVPAREVEEGFSEGRQYTMGAADLLRHGIVDEILHGTSPLPQRPTGNTDDTQALRLAAYIEDLPEIKAEDKPDDDKKDNEDASETNSNDEPEKESEDEKSEGSETEKDDADDEDDESEDTKPKTVAAAFEKRLSGLQSAKDREIHDLQTQLSNAAEARDEALAQCKQLQAQAENARQELADLREQLDKANERQRRLTGAALTDTPDAMDRDTARKLFAATPVSKRAEFYSKHKNLL